MQVKKNDISAELRNLTHVQKENIRERKNTITDIEAFALFGIFIQIPNWQRTYIKDKKSS